MTYGSNNRTSRFRDGFTLIELLVVIAIIALLLSIMMPALGRAKELAKAVLCMNNQKQMGVFLFMYAEENDGKVIEVQIAGNQNNVPIRWADRFFYEEQYTDSSELFYCPGSKVPEGVEKKWGAEYEFNGFANASWVYGLRGGAFSDASVTLKLDKIPVSPSRYILLSDYSWVGTNSGSSSYFSSLDRCQYYMLSKWQSFFMVHRRAANVLTADMAVGTYKVDDLVRLLPDQGDMVTATGTSLFDGPAAFLYPEGTARDVNGDEVLNY